MSGFLGVNLPEDVIGEMAVMKGIEGSGYSDKITEYFINYQLPKTEIIL